MRKYIKRMTGLSGSQITKIIKKKKEKRVACLSAQKKNSFPRKYTADDVSLLVKTDNLHSRLSEPTTKEILKREVEVFKKEKYEMIAKISSSHIYNVRDTRQYRSHSLTVKKTCATSIPIGRKNKTQSLL